MRTIISIPLKIGLRFTAFIPVDPIHRYVAKGQLFTEVEIGRPHQSYIFETIASGQRVPEQGIYRGSWTTSAEVTWHLYELPLDPYAEDDEALRDYKAWERTQQAEREHADVD